MSLLPTRFLLRISHTCNFVKKIPKADEDRLLDLPPSCKIDHFPTMDQGKNFADVRMAWNELGLAVQVEVKGKDQLPQCQADRARSSDGLSLWIDTRDSRSSHRASRFCHQFHFLPAGGGPDSDEPALIQSKIHRALQDAPISDPKEIPFRAKVTKSGYYLEAFLPQNVLAGYDPDQNRKLGFYYVVRDMELGEQLLSVGSDFPYWEDPSLWSILELAR